MLSSVIVMTLIISKTRYDLVASNEEVFCPILRK